MILELGFFYGRLGWDKTFVVFRRPSTYNPHFEGPSDLDGVVFHTVGASNRKQDLAQRLIAEGLSTDESRLPSGDVLG